MSADYLFRRAVRRYAQDPGSDALAHQVATLALRNQGPPDRDPSAALRLRRLGSKSMELSSCGADGILWRVLFSYETPVAAAALVDSVVVAFRATYWVDRNGVRQPISRATARHVTAWAEEVGLDPVELERVPGEEISSFISSVVRVD